MKKIIMFVLLAVAVNCTAVYAKEETVSAKVLEVFAAKFTNAKNVRWIKADELYRADFYLNEQQVCAFYSTEGDFLALVRHLSITQLPLQLINAVQEKTVENYKVTELFEMITNNGTSYYAAIEDAATVKILRSSDGNSWTVFKKKKKK